MHILLHILLIRIQTHTRTHAQRTHTNVGMHKLIQFFFASLLFIYLILTLVCGIINIVNHW